MQLDLSNLPPLWAIEAELARQKLREFVRQAWHVVEPGTTFVDGWHIDAICEHLEAVSYGQIRRLLLNMPPRHMKSLLVSVFWPCWEWISRPQTRWLFSSYAESLSIRDSLKCRRILESPWFQQNWGAGSLWECQQPNKLFRLVGDQNEKKKFENDRTGYRIATSVDGSNTGEGADILVVDDPHNVRDAASDLLRGSVLTWHDEVMSSRFNDPKTGREVVVMQRVHESDLSGHLIEQGGWEHLELPAEYDARDFVAA